MDPEVRAVHGPQRGAEVRERGLGGGADLLLGHDDPHRPPASITLIPWIPTSSYRMPVGVSSVTSTSAIRWLRVASAPTNSMPAARRMTLRPPSAPTR